MATPICPQCGKPVTRVLDAPYGWWEWDIHRYGYVRRTAAPAGRVDVASWVHYDCMGELREMHPQDYPPAKPAPAA